MVKNQPRPLIILLMVIMLLTFALRLIPEPRTIDDAFITFRYSRNLADGNGFVYNRDVRTLGTTTPFYTVLMAGISLITGSENYPWFALIVNALADAITAALLALLFYQVTKRLSGAAVIGVLWAVSPMSVTFAIGGMETSVVILWSVAAAYCYFTKHERWMAVFAALGMLTRIDTVLWIGLLLLHQLITRWREKHTLPWDAWIILVGMTLPWFLFSWAYFDVLIPRSLSAKRVAYVIDGLQALTRLLQHIATPFLENETLGVPAVVIGIVLFPCLAGVGTYYAVRRASRLVPFLMYPWAYVVIFSIANPLIFRWYLAPLLPAYFLAILLGIWAIIDGASKEKLPRAVPVGLTAAGVIFLFFSLNAWTLHPDHTPDRPAPKMAWHKIELDYKQMGEKLRKDCGVTDDTLVAAGDIGAVGYYTGARILDTIGLVTPKVSSYYPADKAILVEDQNYAIPPALILDYQPQYIVVMEAFVRNGLEKDARFKEQYEQIDFIPTDFYGTGMILYERRDGGGRCQS